MNNTKPSVLTIAGSDSGGGAGIQTDLRTFNAFKVYGCSAITAVTAQNPHEVRKVDVMSSESLNAQIEAVLAAFPIVFAKTGMLADSELVECVAKNALKYKLQLIVDPVMVSTSGTRLLEESAISAVQGKIFPLAEWITPNIPEAELICKCKIESASDLAEAAHQLSVSYKCNVILKSGHAVTSGEVQDIVCYHGKLWKLSSPAVKIDGKTAHGTGCTLSAAMTANFAWGRNWREALTEAKAFVYGSLCECTALSPNLSQMYPPCKNYLNQITLEEL